MRPLFAILLCLLLSGLVSAQDSPTPYEIALQRIEEARLSETHILDLSGLGLAELPPEIGQLTNLVYLDLEYNNLQSFPASIGNLSKLERLDAGNNQITSLPTEFSRLQSLDHLKLWFNEFSDFPIIVTELHSLYILTLGANNISSIPSEIGKLRNLCWLELGGNQITVLPRELINLQGLLSGSCSANSYVDGLNFCCNAELAINNNPIIYPPLDVIEQGTPAIFDYLRNQAWWHLQRLILGGASGIAILAIGILGLRWRNNRRKGKKKNQALITKN